MPKRPQKTPKATWLYVAILTLIVLIFWSFFWKKEFKLKEVKNDNKSLGEILNDFTSTVNGGGETIGQIVQEIVGGDKGRAPQELIDQLSEKISQQLWQKRIADWQEWTNQDFSFQLPTNWFWQEEDEVFIITSFNESLSLQPADRVRIEISFLDNPNSLITEEWWTNQQLESLNPYIIDSTNEIIDSIAGIKKIIENNPDSLASQSELILIPLEEQMLQLFIDFFGDSESIQQTVDDFKKTIDFSY